MATVTKGQTFGATEQITNTKLHNLVDLATITNIVNADVSASAAIVDSKLATITTSGKVSGIAISNLGSLASTAGEINTGGLLGGRGLINLASTPSVAGRVPGANLWAYNLLATNTSIPDLKLGNVFRIPWSTYGSIASFTNMTSGQIFTLIANQASFPVITDAGAFKLSADWIANSADDSLTLIWDGTSFVEIGRSNN